MIFIFFIIRSKTIVKFSYFNICLNVIIINCLICVCFCLLIWREIGVILCLGSFLFVVTLIISIPVSGAVFSVLVTYSCYVCLFSYPHYPNRTFPPTSTFSELLHIHTLILTLTLYRQDFRMLPDPLLFLIWYRMVIVLNRMFIWTLFRWFSSEFDQQNISVVICSLRE